MKTRHNLKRKWLTWAVVGLIATSAFAAACDDDDDDDTNGDTTPVATAPANGDTTPAATETETDAEPTEPAAEETPAS